MKIPPIAVVASVVALAAAGLWFVPTQAAQVVAMVDGTVVVVGSRIVAFVLGGTTAAWAFANDGQVLSTALPPGLAYVVQVVASPLPASLAVAMLCVVLSGTRPGAFVFAVASLMGLCAIGEHDPHNARTLIAGWVGLTALSAMTRVVQAITASALAVLILVGEMQRALTCAGTGCLTTSPDGWHQLSEPAVLIAAIFVAAIVAWFPWQGCKFAHAHLRRDWLRWRRISHEELWRGAPLVVRTSSSVFGNWSGKE